MQFYAKKIEKLKIFFDRDPTEDEINEYFATYLTQKLPNSNEDHIYDPAPIHGYQPSPEPIPENNLEIDPIFLVNNNSECSYVVFSNNCLLSDRLNGIYEKLFKTNKTRKLKLYPSPDSDYYLLSATKPNEIFLTDVTRFEAAQLITCMLQNCFSNPDFIRDFVDKIYGDNYHSSIIPEKIEIISDKISTYLFFKDDEDIFRDKLISTWNNMVDSNPPDTEKELQQLLDKFLNKLGIIPKGKVEDKFLSYELDILDGVYSRAADEILRKSDKEVKEFMESNPTKQEIDEAFEVYLNPDTVTDVRDRIKVKEKSIGYIASSILEFPFRVPYNYIPKPIIKEIFDILNADLDPSKITANRFYLYPNPGLDEYVLSVNDPGELFADLSRDETRDLIDLILRSEDLYTFERDLKRGAMLAWDDSYDVRETTKFITGEIYKYWPNNSHFYVGDDRDNFIKNYGKDSEIVDQLISAWNTIIDYYQPSTEKAIYRLLDEFVRKLFSV